MKNPVYEYILYANAPVNLANGNWPIIHIQNAGKSFELSLRAARVEGNSTGQTIIYGYFDGEDAVTLGEGKLLDEILLSVTAESGSPEWLFIRNMSADSLRDITVEIK